MDCQCRGRARSCTGALTHGMPMTETSPIIIRPARREDVAAIIAMLADDHLGRARERVEDPLPQVYYDAFEKITRDPNLTLVVAEDAGRVVGCLQLCIMQ